MRRLLFTLLLFGCGEKEAPVVQDTGEPEPEPTDTDTPPIDTDPPEDTGEECEPEEEVCDGIDNDCDGEIDEPDASDAGTWYADADGDGYGDAGAVTAACEQPVGTVTNSTDCDDTNAAQHPGADEVCNSEDDDCDDAVDEDAADALTWYADADGDGYGDEDESTAACSQPTGYVAGSADCDDTDAAINPDAEEVCDEPIDYNCDGDIGYADVDGDGWAACVDCDDLDADISPGSPELCDEIDNDCDGDTDEDGASDAPIWYLDADLDGYGDPDTTAAACSQPSGYLSDDSDCDDTDADISPDAAEVCDSIDNDCDGDTDEDDAVDADTWYADDDSDGFGNPDAASSACEQPSGFVADDEDCDDSDSAQYPGADEYCNGEDDDCDGETDEDGALEPDTFYADADGDGYGDPDTTTEDCEAPSGYVADDTDCDDADQTQYPGAYELCNDEDDDCDGTTDEDPVDINEWYADADGDGHGDPDSTTEACDAPSGYVAADTDCDDTDADISPDADEVCDSIDNDCDSQTDEGTAVDADTWYADSDGDGYGDPDVEDSACEQPSGFVADDEDCDDSDSAQHPGADEYCNGEDDDCDGETDEDGALEPDTFYADADGDGYGDPDTTTEDCEAPSGYVADGTDCDDDSTAINPGADEVCNSEDDDCDGETDEDAVDADTFYADTDADGHGDAGSTVDACSQPSGYVADATDCDDGDAAQHPGADEVCNSEDDDCDGATDEDPTDGTAFYADADADGYGNPDSSLSECAQPSGYVTSADDCDDSDSAQHPGADEYCNSEDDDCDGVTDEDDALDASTWYEDADADGYGDPGADTVACDQPTGYVAPPDALDCDDDDDSVYPGAVEVCGDAQVNDCDGSLDDAFAECGLIGDIDLVDADAILLGEDSTDYAGSALSFAGDVDGDGLDDLIIGAYNDEEGGSAAGAAYLVLGGVSGEVSLSAAEAVFTGESASDYAGYSVSGDCDIDGDGYHDLLIGAYGDDDGNSQAGAVYVMFGAVSGTIALADADIKLTGEDAGDFAGWSVRCAGDTNNDELDDLIIGAYNDEDGGSASGSAYLILGGISAGFGLSGADSQLVGEKNSDYAGYSVSGAGDVDGDGLDDLLIGAYGDDDSDSESGAVYVVMGGVSGDMDLSLADHKLIGEDGGDNAGWSVSGAGDTNGDGLDDVVVGAPRDITGGSYAGAAYLVLGGLTGDMNLADAHAELIGESSTDYAGWSVSGAGDVDGDALSDFLIGAYGDDDGGSNAGAGYLILGGISGYLDLSRADAKLAGTTSGDYAGRAVAGGGDADGDGLSDILIGAYSVDDAGSAAGAAYLLLGGGY